MPRTMPTIISNRLNGETTAKPWNSALISTKYLLGDQVRGRRFHQ
jgi:hypothetical protein